jgi:hypothetical protein
MKLLRRLDAPGTPALQGKIAFRTGCFYNRFGLCLVRSYREDRMTKTRTRPNPVAGVRRDMPAGIFRAGRRRKSLRQHFRDGLEAALKAEPEAFAATKPRTMMGLMIREVVCGAASARCDAIRLVFSYVDEGGFSRAEAESEDAGDNSQRNSEPESAGETKWDWDGEKGWDSSRREKKPGELDAERAARTEALREQLRERFIRAAEAAKENQEREARLAAERAGQTAPNLPPAQFSGNIAPHAAGTIRIGGKRVEG